MANLELMAKRKTLRAAFLYAEYVSTMSVGKIHSEVGDGRQTQMAASRMKACRANAAFHSNARKVMKLHR